MFLAHWGGVSNSSFALISNRPQQKNKPFVCPVWIPGFALPPVPSTWTQHSQGWGKLTESVLPMEAYPVGYLSLLTSPDTPAFSTDVTAVLNYVLVMRPCTAQRKREWILSASWVAQRWNALWNMQARNLHGTSFFSLLKEMLSLPRWKFRSSRQPAGACGFGKGQEGVSAA